MSFALPTALLLSALAIPILVFYILKVRMRRLPVSTNLFWQQIYDEKPPRSIWQNLRHLLSLLAQLFLLMLLVFAIADPFLPWQVNQTRRIVLVLDHSASMKANDVAPTRFEAAKERALQIINGLRERDQMAVVLAGETPEVVVGMTGHTPTLRRAIEGILPSDNPTELSTAINLGRQLVGDHPRGQVVVLTDGCDPAPPTATEQKTAPPEGKPETMIAVDYEIFATPANNLGITQFQVRRSLSDAVGYEILTSVWNASTEAIECRLEITLDDIPVDILPLKLQPGERWKRALEKTSVEGGVLVASLTEIASAGVEDPTNQESDRLNRLSVDDRAWAVLPNREYQSVLIVSPGNLFLQRVFQAIPLVNLTVTDAIPEAWPTDTLVVLHRLVPEKLPDGKVWVIDPQADSDVWKSNGLLENPIITEQDEQSPLMTHIRLDNVVVPEAVKLDFLVPQTVLAGTVDGETVFSEIKRDNGKLLVLSLNLEQSDLAFRTAFPILVSNSLSWFAGESGDLQPSLPSGSLLTVKLDAESPQSEQQDSSKQYTLIGPDELTTAVSVDREQLTLGPFTKTGIWTLREPESETPLREIAVNLSNERETNLVPETAYDSSTTATNKLAGWFSRPLWFYLASLGCLFAAVEWFLYQRRFIS